MSHRLIGAAIAAAALCALGDADADVAMGMHLGSWHSAHFAGQRNENPGLYVRAGAWTVGGYRNSLDRTSMYATWSFAVGPVDLAIGAVTGYGMRTQHGLSCFDVARRMGWASADAIAFLVEHGRTCWWTSGHGRNVSPIGAASVTLPAIGGSTPRLTFIPAAGANRAHVVHLSLEAPFR